MEVLMKTKILYITIAILLFSLVLVSGEVAYVNTDFTVWADIKNGSVYYDADIANIIILAPDGSVFENGEMGKYDTGVFNYTFNPLNYSGEWYVSVVYVKNDSNISIGSETISVLQNDAQSTSEELSMLSVVVLTTFVVLFGLIIASVGYIINNAILYIFAGVWYIGVVGLLATAEINIGNSYIGGAFFSVLAIALVWQGVSTLISNKKQIDE
jgi:hypothetical protein